MYSRPGFRLLWRDVPVLLIAVIGSWCLWPWSPLAGSLVVVVVAHFFLFCNVFRVPSRLELIWALGLLLNVIGSSLLEALQWPRYLAVQVPVTLAILAWTMCRPDYRGVFWRWVNPRLHWPPPPEG